MHTCGTPCTRSGLTTYDASPDTRGHFSRLFPQIASPKLSLQIASMNALLCGLGDELLMDFLSSGKAGFRAASSSGVRPSRLGAAWVLTRRTNLASFDQSGLQSNNGDAIAELLSDPAGVTLTRVQRQTCAVFLAVDSKSFTRTL